MSRSKIVALTEYSAPRCDAGNPVKTARGRKRPPAAKDAAAATATATATATGAWASMVLRERPKQRPQPAGSGRRVGARANTPKQRPDAVDSSRGRDAASHAAAPRRPQGQGTARRLCYARKEQSRRVDGSAASVASGGDSGSEYDGGDGCGRGVVERIRYSDFEELRVTATQQKQQRGRKRAQKKADAADEVDSDLMRSLCCAIVREEQEPAQTSEGIAAAVRCVSLLCMR